MTQDFPSYRDSLVIFTDIQESLFHQIPLRRLWLADLILFAKAVGWLEIPRIVTEQYPQGLGTTIEQLRELPVIQQATVHEKTTFSCWRAAKFREDLESRSTKPHIFLVGLETSICVYHTALDLTANGYAVTVVSDAVAGRYKRDHENALQDLRTRGVHVTPMETVIFGWLGDSRHPRFKDISALVKARGEANL